MRNALLAVLLFSVTTTSHAQTPTIACRDGDLFPLARRVLTPAALATLGREMAQRRGLAAGHQV
jgi:hypothetical protein